MENDSAARFGTYDLRLDAMVDWSKVELRGEAGGEKSCMETESCLSGLLLWEKQDEMDHLEARRLWLPLEELLPLMLRLAMPLKMEERRRAGVAGPLEVGELGAEPKEDGIEPDIVGNGTSFSCYLLLLSYHR